MSTFTEGQHPRGQAGKFTTKDKAGAGVSLAEPEQAGRCQPEAARIAEAVQRLLPGHEVDFSVGPAYPCGAPEGAEFLRIECYGSLHERTGESADAELSISGYLFPGGAMPEVTLVQQWESIDPRIGADAESLTARDFGDGEQLAGELPNLMQRIRRRSGVRKTISDQVPFSETGLIPRMATDTKVRMEWAGKGFRRETVVFDLSAPEGAFAPEIHTPYGDVRVDDPDREMVVSNFGRELLMAQDQFEVLGHEDSAQRSYDYAANLFSRAWAADPIEIRR